MKRIGWTEFGVIVSALTLILGWIQYNGPRKLQYIFEKSNVSELLEGNEHDGTLVIAIRNNSWFAAKDVRVIVDPLVPNFKITCDDYHTVTAGLNETQVILIPSIPGSATVVVRVDVKMREPDLNLKGYEFWRDAPNVLRVSTDFGIVPCDFVNCKSNVGVHPPGAAAFL